MCVCLPAFGWGGKESEEKKLDEELVFLQSRRENGYFMR